MRFAPKIKRRPLSGVNSNRASVTATPEPGVIPETETDEAKVTQGDESADGENNETPNETGKINKDNEDEEEDKEQRDDDEEEDEDDEDDDFAVSESAHASRQIISRPKRLSSLGTAPNRDLFKRSYQAANTSGESAASGSTSITSRRRLSSSASASIIGIPQQPQSKRRKSSVNAKSQVKRKPSILEPTQENGAATSIKPPTVASVSISPSIDPPSPPQTQQAVDSTPSEAQDKEAKTIDQLTPPSTAASQETDNNTKKDDFSIIIKSQDDSGSNTVTDAFKLEDLCRPSLPIGKVSSYFHQAQEARKNKMRLRIERRKIRIAAREKKLSVEEYLKLYPRSESRSQQENDEKQQLDGNPTEGEGDAEVVGEEIKTQEAEPVMPVKGIENLPENSNGLKLTIKDGHLTIDEDSRVIDRHATTGPDLREKHNENPFENIVNSATYGRQRYTDKWDDLEIQKFYQALSQWGTDFALIAQMFPYRTRRQVKAKFILEEKKRPALVELALSRKLGNNFVLQNYEAESNKKFGTLSEFNEKIKQLKREHEQNLKELSIAKEKAREEDALKQKKKEFEVKTGQRQLTRQERLMELRKGETVIGSVEDKKPTVSSLAP